MRTARRIFGEHAMDELPNRARRRRGQRRRDELARHGEHLAWVLPGEWRRTCHERMDDRAEREDVRPRVDLAAERLLRREIARSPAYVAKCRERKVVALRDPEVEELR